jgi:CrcB protein
MLRPTLVALGGLLGSLARYWLAGVAQRWSDSPFPAGTWTVNVFGSFLIGLIMTLSLERGLLNAHARLFLTVGVCGGFTTMSTFGYETWALLRDGETLLALANVSASLIACVGAVWLGALAGRYV